MKRILMLICVIVFLVNCSSGDSGNSASMQQMTTNTQIKGNFVSGAHPTSGTASINAAKTQLNLINFKTEDGPELVVYLSTEVGSSDFVSLGDLKGISGNFSYNIPSGTDLEKYKIVDIWCIAASVSFGHAELE